MQDFINFTTGDFFTLGSLAVLCLGYLYLQYRIRRLENLPALKDFLKSKKKK